MLLLTGDFYSAQEAYNWGDVDKVVPADEMEEVAREIADKLSRLDLAALRLTKDALWKVKGMNPEEARLYTWDLLASYSEKESSKKLIKEYRSKVEKMTGKPYIPGGG
jgi:enoyl-CoA hydratase/carnithine racemase